MKKLIMRLDDAAEQMDYKRWKRMENLLDKYNIKPIVGVIPDSKDPDFIKYKKINNFWDLVSSWEKKSWIIAMHGYQHLLTSKDGGINPINNYSEFAGLSFDKQSRMIKEGYDIFISKGIEPKVFFAPAHTFDNNTLEAIKNETNIRIISDTIAFDIYYKEPFYFIPQQSGKCRNLPFKTITYCYHPNTMTNKDFEDLELFIKNHNSEFSELVIDNFKKRKSNIIDTFLKKIYYLRRKGQ